MNTLKKFAVAKARALPVIILADTSGSMSVDGKIAALNEAIKNMVSTFKKDHLETTKYPMVQMYLDLSLR